MTKFVYQQKLKIVVNFIDSLCIFHKLTVYHLQFSNN